MVRARGEWEAVVVVEDLFLRLDFFFFFFVGMVGECEGRCSFYDSIVVAEFVKKVLCRGCLCCAASLPPSVGGLYNLLLLSHFVTT